MAELNQAPAQSGGRTSKKLSTRVDLTAMVDLAFLLVTFFMLTTRLSKPVAQRLAMPVDGEPAPVAASHTVTLCLGKNDQLVYYRGTLDSPIDAPEVVGFSKNGLRQALMAEAEKIRQLNKPMIVVVKPGEHSVYSNLVNTIDELNITHVPIYAVADISAKDIELLKQKEIF